MQSSKGKTIATVIGYVLVVVILVTVVGLIYRFTNGFNEDFKTFYIEYDGNQIFTTDSKMSLDTGTTYRFDVKYTFDTENSEPKDYSVKGIPNVERDFDFTGDGERYLFSKEADLTSGFDLKKQDTYFEITISSDFCLRYVLQSCYAGQEVVVPDEAEISNTYPYSLVVSSYNDSVVYKIDLSVGVDVIGVTLDQTEIVFSGVS